jgi:hypothetical protein
MTLNLQDFVLDAAKVVAPDPDEEVKCRHFDRQITLSSAFACL